MTEESSHWHSFSIEKNVDIRIDSIENIARTDSTSVHFIVEHNGVVLGESDPMRIEPNYSDTPSVYDVNFNANYNILCDQRSLIDSLASTPVIIKAVMSMDRDSISGTSDDSKKKSKFTAKSPSSHTAVFGICNIDLMPILLGEDKYTQKIRLETAEFDFNTPVTSLALLTVTLLQDDVPLFPIGENINYMSITIESIYNIPDSFNGNLEFTAGTIVYVDSETPEHIIFNDGARLTIQDFEKAKRWNTLWQLPSRAALSNYKLDSDFMGVRNPFQDEFNLAEQAHQSVPRIVWNSVSRHILREPGIEATKSHIAKHSYWPFQFLVSERAPDTAKTKGKEKGRSYMYECYLDISELLFPGKRSTRVVEQLRAFNASDITDIVGLENNIFNAELQSKEPRVKEKKSKGPKYAQSVISESEVPTTAGVTASSGKPTVIIIEIELYQPLVPSRIAPDFAQMVGELKGMRPKKSLYVYSPNVVEEHYRNCIQKLTELLTESYRDFREQREKAAYSEKDEESEINCPTEQSDELACFTQYLYKTGLYVSVRNTLRAKVALVLDQKFRIESHVVESVETQNFIASIYTYLVERMHMAMNEIVEGRSVEHQEGQLSMEKLYFYAEEALELGFLDEARRFYTTGIARNKKNPGSWTKYAIFHLRTGDLERATECVREAILLNSRYRIALLLYGGILYQQDEYHDAEIFFRAVTELYPRFIEGWTILHVFYLQTEYCPGMDVTLRIAEKCMKDKIRDLEISYSEPLAWEMIHCPQDSVYTIAATLLLKLGLPELACAALTEEMSKSESVHILYYLAVECYLANKYEDALAHLEEAGNTYGQDYSIGSLMGHCHYLKGDFEEAIDCYEFVSTLFNRPDDMHLVEVRMGIHFLEQEQYEKAMKIFLIACKTSPSAQTWFRLGISFYHLNQFQKAEAALTEANSIDNFNAEIWGYLCLLNLTLDRYDEFVQCYRESVKNNLRNTKLWLTIAESMEAAGIAPPLVTLDTEDDNICEN